MQIVVLNDGQYFSELDGCQILTLSDDFKWDDVDWSYASEIPPEKIVSRVVLNTPK
jgi:hypothetical protein